jgi:alpha-tubulin suppressor-like RCC1 family protein
VIADEYVQEVPRKLVKSKKFEKVSIGPSWTLGVSNTGDLYGWGRDYMPKEHSLEPVHIAPGLKVKSVASGYKHNAVIGMDGQIYTWGNGGSWFSGGGQLGTENCRAKCCLRYHIQLTPWPFSLILQVTAARRPSLSPGKHTLDATSYCQCFSVI